MSQPQPPQPAKLVIGTLFNDKSLMPAVKAELEQAFGSVDQVGPWMDFDFTEYYSKEMGARLYRCLMAFERLIRQEDLAGIKLVTNTIESSYARDGRRSVNLDPGFLLYERFVLATGKNYSHRIYIGQCIYADLTLVYQQGTYQALPWTYPDYRDPRTIEFLLQVREQYGDDLKKDNSGANRTC